MNVARALHSFAPLALFACGGAHPEPAVSAPGKAQPVASSAPVASAEPAKIEQPTPPVVNTEKLVFLKSKDGLVVATRTEAGDRKVWVGDEKTLYEQRVFGGGSDGTRGSWDVVMWAPRAPAAQGSLDFDGTKYSGSCSHEGSFPLTAYADADQARLANSAKLEKPLWDRQAVFLARDDRGVYYFVDGIRADRGKTGQRVFIGKSGELKEQKMKNIVDDQAGMIFETVTGQLRLVTSKSEASWIAGKGKQPLVVLEVQENARLIYKTLGVYGKLGTLCDNE